VPGLGKTLLVRSLATALECGFARVQFTPDLMPSDVSGHAFYDPKTETFKIRRGPVFTNLLLADEINRAPAKTQAALLEVMQEQQVTIESRSFPLSPPFLTVATQNPIEQEGTYPLPEAQLDRFLLKILMNYPGHDDEVRMVTSVSAGRTASDFDLSRVRAVAKPEDIVAMQLGTAQVRVDAVVLDYAVRITRATRDWPGITMGAGPRGSLSLVRAARGQAVLDGRDFVTPDDVRAIAKPALRHRVGLLKVEAPRR
jgi:MoxR-like ATPase